MHPIFIAHGPHFKQQYTGRQFNSVDIYELMCHILKVKPAKNDGSLRNVEHILLESSSALFTMSNLAGNTSTFLKFFLVIRNVSYYKMCVHCTCMFALQSCWR